MYSGNALIVNREHADSNITRGRGSEATDDEDYKILKIKIKGLETEVPKTSKN